MGVGDHFRSFALVRKAATYAVITAFVAMALLVGGSGHETEAVPSPASVPKIVKGGVKMVDAWNMPTADWQAWLSRPPGDDTHGRGDLFAVSVEFTEAVKVHSEATFRVDVGGYQRDLVYGARTGNVIFFATTVPSFWRDFDGIRIGDGTETLGHNRAGLIKHRETAVHADLSHAAVGRLSNHKVNGRISRPNVTKIELEGPSCHDNYLRDEKIVVKVSFDQAVRVQGTPQAVLKIRGGDGQRRVRADYVRGNGSSAIYLEYQVQGGDAEPVGVLVNQNAMLVQRDRGNLPLNRAKVVGQQGGLMADLRTDGVRRRETSPVDGSRLVGLYCETAMHGLSAGVKWKWNQRAGVSDRFTIKFSVDVDPGVGAGNNRTVLQAGRFKLGDWPFVIGISNGESEPGSGDPKAKVVFCATLDPIARHLGTTPEGGWQVVPRTQGRPKVVVMPYEWTTGTYKLTVDQGVSSGREGLEFDCKITKYNTDGTAGETVDFGGFNYHGLPTSSMKLGEDPMLTKLSYMGSDAVRPIDIPVMQITAERPKFARVRRPSYGLVDYRTDGGVDNGLVTADLAAETVTLKVGGETTHEGVNQTGTKLIFDARR